MNEELVAHERRLDERLNKAIVASENRMRGAAWMHVSLVLAAIFTSFIGVAYFQAKTDSRQDGLIAEHERRIERLCTKEQCNNIQWQLENWHRWYQDQKSR